MVIFIWIYRIALNVTTNDDDKCDGRSHRIQCPMHTVTVHEFRSIQVIQ